MSGPRTGEVGPVGKEASKGRTMWPGKSQLRLISDPETRIPDLESRTAEEQPWNSECVARASLLPLF